MKPIVNVIIPTYNRCNELNECLRSLELQSFKQFKVTICDDGSTDDTRGVIKKFCNKLHIDYFFNSNSGGPAIPRNVGIKNTKESYIAFLDSDDYWKKDKLKLSLYALRNGADFIYHDLSIVHETKISQNSLKNRPLKKPFFDDLLLHGNKINCSSVVCKSSLISTVGFFDTHIDCNAAEDFDMWLRIAKNGYEMIKISGNLGYYRLHQTNISNYTRTYKYTNYIYSKYIKDIKKISIIRPIWMYKNIFKYFIKRGLRY